MARVVKPGLPYARVLQGRLPVGPVAPGVDRQAVGLGEPPTALVPLSVEDALVAAEVRAVSCSTPVGEGVEFLRSCLARKMKVGIVSNNSADAVHVFLDDHGLSGDVTPVVGRALRHPELMKPNPWPMEKALTTADVPARSAVYVGDSLSDIEVAHAVSVPCVAYANKPGKREQFEGVGAAVVIDSMSELSAALVA